MIESKEQAPAMPTDTTEVHESIGQSTVIEEVQHKLFSAGSAVEDVANSEVERLGRMMIPHLLQLLRDNEATCMDGREDANEEQGGGDADKEEVSVALIPTAQTAADRLRDSHPHASRASASISLRSRGRDGLVFPSPHSPHSPRPVLISPLKQTAGLSPRQGRAPSWGLRHEIDLQRNGSLLDFKPGSDVPTLRSGQVALPGSSVCWRLKLTSIGRKFASRFGVISYDLKAKTDWGQNACNDRAWYLSFNGLFNGATAVHADKFLLRSNDVLGCHLSWGRDRETGRLRFSVNGRMLPPEIADVRGPVFFACQLLNKGDSVQFLTEELQDVDELSTRTREHAETSAMSQGVADSSAEATPGVNQEGEEDKPSAELEILKAEREYYLSMMAKLAQDVSKWKDSINLANVHKQIKSLEQEVARNSWQQSQQAKEIARHANMRNYLLNRIKASESRIEKIVTQEVQSKLSASDVSPRYQKTTPRFLLSSPSSSTPRGSSRTANRPQRSRRISGERHRLDQLEQLLEQERTNLSFRPKSARTRSVINPFDMEKRMGQTSRTPEEKKIFRLASRGELSSELEDVSFDLLASTRREEEAEAFLRSVREGDTAKSLSLISNVSSGEYKVRLASQALPLCVKHGNEELCRQLVPMSSRQGLNLALFCAAQFGQLNLLRLVLEAGAEVNARNADEATPLILAAFHGNREGVDELLRRGADVNAFDGDQYTALMWAAFKGRSEAAEVLINHGADMRMVSKEGNSALTYAAYSGCEQLIDLMLERGVGSDSNSSGLSAADIAGRQGHKEIEEKLRKALGV